MRQEKNVCTYYMYVYVNSILVVPSGPEMHNEKVIQAPGYQVLYILSQQMKNYYL